jgi:hypothetical protein
VGFDVWHGAARYPSGPEREPARTYSGARSRPDSGNAGSS